MRIVERSTGEVFDIEPREVLRRVRDREWHVWSQAWWPDWPWIDAGAYAAAKAAAR